MILADKIVELRKKNNWSQEELAGKINVSRQAISKWESAQSTPDLDRIIKMSEIFGVSTDYLLKDDIEMDSADIHTEGEGISLRRLSMEEANNFIDIEKRSSKPVAFGVLLCVVAVIPLILAEDWTGFYYKDAITTIISIVMVASAVAIFILDGLKLKEYEWIEKEPFETAYGVDGMVKEKIKNFMPQFTFNIVIGVVLCILSISMFVASDFLPKVMNITENGVISIGFFMIAVAVYMMVKVGIIKSSYNKILQQGEFTIEAKENIDRNNSFMTIYWLIVIAIFLFYSLYTNDWGRSWVIWPVAGVISAVLHIFLSSFHKSK